MDLYTHFSRVAQAQGDKIAIVHERQQVTYRALHSLCESARRGLARTSGRDRVFGLLTSNPVDFVAVYLAAAADGTRIVLLDARSAPSELRASTELFAITHAVCAPQQARSLGASNTEHELFDGRVAVVSLARRPSPAVGYRDSDFVVHCTSGSTGQPKGIVLSVGNIVHRVQNWSATIGLTPEDTVLCTLTLAHCHGIDVLMLPGLINGCRVIAPALDRLSPRRVCGLFEKEGVTVFSSLPFFYETMLETIPTGCVDLRSLRYLISGSAPLSEKTARRFRDQFGRGIQQVYGLSEIGVICLDRDPEHTGYVGDFIEGISGKVMQAGDDGVGELVVTGAALARGYLDSPDAQRLMFRDGWLWTQDLVSRDSSGIRIVGRRSRFINTAGSKVDPAELEGVLREHPAISEAVITSRSDSFRGEVIVAHVQVRTPVTVDELASYMQARLALYKVPSEFRFVDRIPRSGIGKVQIGELARAADQSAALGSGGKS